VTSADLPARAVARQAEERELRIRWRSLGRAATLVALLTSPVAFAWLYDQQGWSLGWALAATFGLVVFYRGLIDVVFRRFLPWPSLFGEEDPAAREDDVLSRRRSWFWRRFFFWFVVLPGAFITVCWFFQGLFTGFSSWWGTAEGIVDAIWDSRNLFFGYLVILVVFFLINTIIFIGPLMAMGISQIRGFEPGDADWGVRLDDVRGQAEAKEEVRKIVSLWQSGEAFVRAGGKRERGILFLGAPGTGKTMLAKAIATGFNSPFVSIPGSGFAQTFIGVDALIVRFLARKAKKLARKWGGQCIVFIDEVDAVGMRRSTLGGGTPTASRVTPASFHDHCFYGPYGALTPTGDLVLEDRAWREKLFAARAPAPAPPGRIGGIVDQMMPGMFGGGGQLALNQLLVVMDGIDNPPFWRRFWTKWINTLLDASYVIPRRVRGRSLRMPQARPLDAQIHFIGATNVPLESLDPALTRPGRLGRHVWFRTPTKKDREDIFELYLGKVDHDAELDGERARDELARITNGYSPAMIEQVCSMALTYAQHDARERFSREDILEAMTTVESGTAVGIEYVPEETRQVAIHEAGHAAAAHVYMKGSESTRLSIRMRAGSLGHHQALEKEERFSRFRSEEMAQLVWTLGAMAAEHAFFGEGTTGVGGDVQSATARAAWMVGACAMAPDPIALNGHPGRNGDESEERDQIVDRFVKLGTQIMNRTGGGGPFHHDPISGVLSDPEQRRLVAQMLGQAYVYAFTLIAANKPAVEHIADTLVDRKEIYGDELIALLDEAKLKKPNLDLMKDETWPAL
jgi:cell division protease FtsH